MKVMRLAGYEARMGEVKKTNLRLLHLKSRDQLGEYENIETSVNEDMCEGDDWFPPTVVNL
jgi:hypothetical protein